MFAAMLQIGCGTVIAKKNFKKKIHGKFSDFFFEFFFGQIFLVKFFHEIAERCVAISECVKIGTSVTWANVIWDNRDLGQA
jgi:hypothetical protein